MRTPKAQKSNEVRFEDHMPRSVKSRGGRSRTGRRSITLWLRADIIDACGPSPATGLRRWIEANYFEKS